MPPADDARIATVSLPDLTTPLTMVVHPDDDKHISEHLLANGHWEPLETELILRFLGSGSLLADCGANIGWYTVVAAAHGADVVAFEPFPINAELLRKNVRRNALDSRVEIHQVALGASEGTATLTLSVDNQGDHRIGAPTTSRRFVDVDITTLDLALGRRQPDVLKLDTQGSEVAIWRGGPSAFRDPSLVVLEFWPYGLRRAGDDVADLLGFIEPMMASGYSCFEIVEFRHGLVPLSFADLVELTRSGGYTEAMRGFTNIALVRSDVCDRLDDLLIEPLS